MAVQPAHDTTGADAVQEPQPPALVGAQPPAADQPGGRQRVFGYLDTASAGRYRQLMGVLLANKRRFGPRMTPTQIAIASGIGSPPATSPETSWSAISPRSGLGGG